MLLSPSASILLVALPLALASFPSINSVDSHSSHRRHALNNPLKWVKRARKHRREIDFAPLHKHLNLRDVTSNATASSSDSKVYTTIALWYNQTGAQDACGGVKTNDDFTVGLPVSLWPDQSAVSSLCGSHVLMTNIDNNATVRLVVSDTSANNYTTISIAAFRSLAHLDVGEINVSYYFLSDAEDAAYKSSASLTTSTTSASAAASITLVPATTTTTPVKTTEVATTTAFDSKSAVSASSVASVASAESEKSIESVELAASKASVASASAAQSADHAAASESAASAAASESSASVASVEHQQSKAAAASASSDAAEAAQASESASNAYASSKSEAQAYASSKSAAAAYASSKSAAAAAQQTKSSWSGSGNSHTYSGGFATFFYQNGVAGACGTVHQDTDKVIAIDSAMYSNGANCGRHITIKRTSDGASVTALVADECPTCDTDTSLDLSVGAFLAIATEVEGEVAITWSFDD